MSYIDLHHEAMEAFDQGKTRRALQLETLAAESAPAELEPTRSVLFRSAASMALADGDATEARRLATEGLRGSPPHEIQVELLEILGGD